MSSKNKPRKSRAKHEAICKQCGASFKYYMQKKPRVYCMRACYVKDNAKELRNLEIRRLYYEMDSVEIGKRLGISKYTVRGIVNAAEKKGLENYRNVVAKRNEGKLLKAMLNWTAKMTNKEEV
jgi:predicted DNA-binding protein (UPF0251 family)